MKTIVCRGCGETVEAKSLKKQWCSEQCAWRYRSGKTDAPVVRSCRICSAEIIIPRFSPKTAYRHHCSDACSLVAAKRSRLSSAKRMAHGEPKHAGGRPRTLTDEQRTRMKKGGIQERFFRLNPHRPRVCESCGEKRFVELAHKRPRNGAWQSLKNTRSEDVWVLCPTCHRCLDHGIQTAEELGLSNLQLVLP